MGFWVADIMNAMILEFHLVRRFSLTVLTESHIKYMYYSTLLPFKLKCNFTWPELMATIVDLKVLTSLGLAM